MRKRKMTTRRNMAAVLSLSLLIAGSASIPAWAGVLDDVGETLRGVGEKIGEFSDQIGVGPVLRDGYNAVSDFIFTYETQPDDHEMENLARSWAVTAWLADEDREETNTYYFDNDTLTMMEDLTRIKGGYNLSKTPEGSYLNGKHTGILKAVVNDATNYTVEWANYDDEVNLYMLQKLKSKNGSSRTEAETDNEEAAASGAASADVANENGEAAAADIAAGSADTAAAAADAAAGADMAAVSADSAAGGTDTAVTDAAAGNPDAAVTDASAGSTAAVAAVAGGTTSNATALAGGTADNVTAVAGGSADNVTAVAGEPATNNVTAVAGGPATNNVTAVAGEPTTNNVTAVAGGPTANNVTAVAGGPTTNNVTAVAGGSTANNVTTVAG